jgi:hypothetical protein
VVGDALHVRPGERGLDEEVAADDVDIPWAQARGGVAVGRDDDEVGDSREFFEEFDVCV